VKERKEQRLYCFFILFYKKKWRENRKRPK
jgi:hypothetical protein